MKILIVDDDPAARLAIKRLVVRDFMAATTEAENGLDALDTLSRERYSLVLLDLQMPLMDGFETLQAIRGCADTASLPVAVMSIIRDEAQVRAIIKLGISDYFIKPLKLKQMSPRISRILQAWQQSQRVTQGSACDAHLDRTSPVLLVDADPDFRHFCTNVLSPRVPFVAVDSGARALKQCLQSPPAVILIGGDTGMPRPELLVQKIRTVHRLDLTQLIAVAPASLLGTVLKSAPYNGGLPRTFVPDVFLDHFNRLFTPGTPLKRLLEVFPAFRLSTITAIEQVFGMMLGLEVTVDAADYPWADEKEVHATQSLSAFQHGLELNLHLCMKAADAHEVTGRMLAQDGLYSSDDDVFATLREVCNIVTGRLQQGLAGRGLLVKLEMPRAQLTEQSDRSWVTGEDVMTIHFRASNGLAFLVGVALSSEQDPLAIPAPARSGDSAEPWETPSVLAS